MKISSALFFARITLLLAVTACSAAPDSHLVRDAAPAVRAASAARRAAALASLPRLGGRTTMNITLSLSAFPSEVAPVASWIQLLDGPTGAVLLSSYTEPWQAGGKTTLFADPLAVRAGPNHRRETVLRNEELLPVALRWDAARDDQDRVVAVFERELGGTHAITLKTTDPILAPSAQDVLRWTPEDWAREGPRLEAQMNREWVSPRERMGEYFSRPRFVRGSAAPPAVTAVVEQTHVELFPDALTSARPASKVIPVACIDALLVMDRHGPSLLYKTRSKAPPSEQETLAGRLYHVRLDRDLHPTGPAVSLFPEHRIFEFDAAPLADGLAVLATLEKGVLAAVGSLATPALEVRARKEEASRCHISSPTILTVGGRIHIGVVCDASRAGTRILHGTLDLDGQP